MLFAEPIYVQLSQTKRNPVFDPVRLLGSYGSDVA
jgi:hypothetical protein